MGGFGRLDSANPCLVRSLPQMSTTTGKQQPDPGTKALLASLESVVMDLNDMENMIENFEESAAESFYSKV